MKKLLFAFVILEKSLSVELELFFKRKDMR